MPVLGDIVEYSLTVDGGRLTFVLDVALQIFLKVSVSDDFIHLVISQSFT